MMLHSELRSKNLLYVYLCVYVCYDVIFEVDFSMMNMDKKIIVNFYIAPSVNEVF